MLFLKGFAPSDTKPTIRSERSNVVIFGLATSEARAHSTTRRAKTAPEEAALYMHRIATV